MLHDSIVDGDGGGCGATLEGRFLAHVFTSRTGIGGTEEEKAEMQKGVE